MYNNLFPECSARFLSGSAVLLVCYAVLLVSEYIRDSGVSQDTLQLGFPEHLLPLHVSTRTCTSEMCTGQLWLVSLTCIGSELSCFALGSVLMYALSAAIH